MLEELRCMRARVAALDAALVSVADCVMVSAELARLTKACAAAQARFAVRSGQRAEDVARACGSSVGAARAAVETINGLDACPVTAAAVASGELSLELAHEITETEKKRPGSESELLGVARSGGLRDLKERARKLRHRATGLDDVHRQRVAAREFRHWKNEIGNIAFCGELPPEQGVPFVNRLEAETDRVRFAAKRGDEPLESRDAYRADAFTHLLTESGGRRAPSTELVIVLDYAAALRGHAKDGELCHVIGGDDIPVELAKELAKGALVSMVIHDGVNPLRIKRFGRYRPVELDTLLRIGPAPGFEGVKCVDCGSEGHLQIDHVDPVANWGPTSYENLAPRCWTCHHEKTERDRRAGLLDGRGPPP